jgi:hypothetical protein
VLEINQGEGKWGGGYKPMRDIMEWTYKRTFHSQYRNQSNDSKNHVISKLQEAFLEQWLMRPVRLAI